VGPTDLLLTVAGPEPATGSVLTGNRWLDWIIIAGVVAGAVAGVWGLIHKPVRAIKAAVEFLNEFQGDWRGVPDRPGVPGREGVMPRLSRIEHEVTLNGGRTVKDTVVRLEDMLTEHLRQAGGR
jgi:hypothetical protein